MAYYKMRPRGGTTADWEKANPILGEQEIAFEYPLGLGKGLVKMKMGDGVTPWNDLPYAINETLTTDIVNSRIVENNTSYLNILDEIKNNATTGKNLIGGVVGGNSSSTFQELANNAQAIKTQRDQYNDQIVTLNNQVSSLNTQLTNITQDRNNWMNIANSKTKKVVKRITTERLTFTIDATKVNYLLLLSSSGDVAVIYINTNYYFNPSLFVIGKIDSTVYVQGLADGGSVNWYLSIAGQIGYVATRNGNNVTIEMGFNYNNTSYTVDCVYYE